MATTTADGTAPAWDARQLDVFAAAEEISIRTRRKDATLRRPVPIWVVRVGDDVFVRSFHGASGAWFTHAIATDAARLEVTGPDDGVFDVTFERVRDDAVLEVVDEAYRGKYARYGKSYLSPMLAPTARAATLRVVAPLA